MEIQRALWATPNKLFQVILKEEPLIDLSLGQYWINDRESFEHDVASAVNSKIMIGLNKVEMLFLFNALVEYFKSINFDEVYSEVKLVKKEDKEQNDNAE